MSSVDRLRRLLVLVPHLLAHPGTTVGALARRFDASPRVILDDLANLAWCGLPGQLGDLYVDVDVDAEERVTLTVPMEAPTPLRLTDDEALRLLLAVESVDAAAGGDEALQAAAAKVRAAAGLSGRLLTERDGEPDADDLAAVAGALRDGRRLRLRYLGRSDEAPVDRFVDPWRLTRAGWWYVQGHDELRDALRSFRVDRCLEVEVLDEPVRVPAPERVPPPRYEAGPDDPTVELVLPPSAAWLVGVVDLDVDEVRPDGSRRVVFRTDALGWVARSVLGSGAPVRVLGPPALVDEVARLARAGRARQR